jgi:hypothetical protein
MKSGTLPVRIPPFYQDYIIGIFRDEFISFLKEREEKKKLGINLGKKLNIESLIN